METSNVHESHLSRNLRDLATRVASGAQRMARLAGPARVVQLMTPTPRTCTPTDSLQRAAQIMWETDCGCVPVVEADGRAVAMITDRDICMAAYTQGRSLKDISVSSAASPTLVAAHVGDRLDAAERLMQAHQVRRLAVVDSNGRLAGVLSLSDIVRHARYWLRAKGLGTNRILITFAAICQPARRKDSPPAAG
jgi:CBS domain-containing protein